MRAGVALAIHTDGKVEVHLGGASASAVAVEEVLKRNFKGQWMSAEEHQARSHMNASVVRYGIASEFASGSAYRPVTKPGFR